MKALKLIALIALLASCKKEESCNCGTIVDDNAADLSITIENECTGNQKVFYLDYNDWTTAYVGTNYCITNSGKW